MVGVQLTAAEIGASKPAVRLTLAAADLYLQAAESSEPIPSYRCRSAGDGYSGLALDTRVGVGLIVLAAHPAREHQQRAACVTREIV
jgi:hypothetical protein